MTISDFFISYFSRSNKENNRYSGVSGHWYPMPHLTKSVDMSGSKAFSSHHIWRFIASVCPSVCLSVSLCVSLSVYLCIRLCIRMLSDNGWMDKWTDSQMDRWTDRQMGGRMDRNMDGRTNRPTWNILTWTFLTWNFYLEIFQFEIFQLENFLLELLSWFFKT